MKLKRKGSDQSLPSIQILSTLNSHICFSSIRWHPNLTSCLLASKRDAYQSWILSSLHAQHSRSVAADKRASRSAGPQPGFPLRGAKPSGWRVTVYNAGFSPFHALILSIVPELSQLPVHRASKRSCDIASSSVCRTPCFFYLHPVLLCSFQISKHTLCTTIWLFTQLPSLAPPFLVSPRSFSLDAWFPIVNRDCIVPPTDLVCPRLWLFCLSQSPWWIGISTMPATCASGHFHSPSLCFDSLQTTVVFVWGLWTWWQVLRKCGFPCYPKFILWWWKSDSGIKNTFQTPPLPSRESKGLLAKTLHFLLRHLNIKRGTFDLQIQSVAYQVAYF